MPPSQQASANNASARTAQPQTKPQIVNIQAQKPMTTVSTVQPQTNTTQSSITQSISNAKTAILQRTSSITSKSSSAAAATSDQTKGKLPQIPPRVQSQSSVTSTTGSASRGPPPAIPPRNNVPAPMRSASIQVASSGALNRPTLARQASANSIQPQCTPQPVPKFVIPQRQNSRTSLNRSGSISGPSSNNHHDWIDEITPKVLNWRWNREFSEKEKTLNGSKLRDKCVFVQNFNCVILAYGLVSSLMKRADQMFKIGSKNLNQIYNKKIFSIEY